MGRLVLAGLVSCLPLAIGGLGLPSALCSPRPGGEVAARCSALQRRPQWTEVQVAASPRQPAGLLTTGGFPAALPGPPPFRSHRPGGPPGDIFLTQQLCESYCCCVCTVVVVTPCESQTERNRGFITFIYTLSNPNGAT
jgi:hypothetical protein